MSNSIQSILGNLWIYTKISCINYAYKYFPGVLSVTISKIWVTFLSISALCALIQGRGSQVTAAAMEGANQAIELSILIAGPLCLWSGAGVLMEKAGVTRGLARLLSPLIFRLFPASKKDIHLAGALSGNICANLLGLGNAATPMGIEAVKRLRDPNLPGNATDQMCRLVVMNTASIQLLPTTVAAVRSGAGAAAPFDILPCVWLSSILSVSAGLFAAKMLAGRWGDG